MKKIALYCRVSSEEQKDKGNIENQVDILNTYVEMKENLSIYDTYLDNGISGTIPLEKRPEGYRLIQDASKNLFDVVLVWKVDRFGRDTLSGLTAVEMLKSYDIEIISITEPFDLNTPIGRFQLTTYLNMAELERNNILDRMFIGATRAAKKGKWVGGIVPYGYTLNKENFLEFSDEKMECDYSEKEVIELIYNSYNNGMNSVDIAVYLNSLNIPSSSGITQGGTGKRSRNTTGKWRSSSIRRILSSTTYKGIHEYGKRSIKRKETITREVPAIVSVDLWQKTQIKKKENQSTCKRNMKKRYYLLRGLIECGNCGLSYYGVSYKEKNAYYVCASKRSDHKRIFNSNCSNPNIQVDSLEEFVWNYCVNILKNYKEYINSLENDINIGDDIEVNIRKVKSSIDNCKKEKNSILTLFRKNIITEEEVEYQLKEINEEEDKQKSLLLSFETALESLKNKESFISSLEDKFSYFNKRINNLNYDDKIQVINLIIKKIVIHTQNNDGVIPYVEIVLNLVKLEAQTDMDSYFKFDIDKKLSPLLYDDSIGYKLKKLRLKNKMTQKQLSKELGFSHMTLLHLEHDKITLPYYYAKKICNYYKVDYVQYLELYSLPEKNYKDKIEKLRAYLGARSWEEVATYLNVKESLIIDYLTRISPTKHHIYNVEIFLNKIKSD